MTNNLRLYSFCNFYLSSFQQGNQSGHLATTMSSKYRGFAKQKAAKVFRDWEDDGITTIVLNGGDWRTISEDYKKFARLYLSLNSSFKKRDFHIPFTYFAEETGSLSEDVTMTCWGFVLPQEIYNAKKISFRSTLGFSPDSEDQFNATSYFFEEGSLEYLACELLQGKSLAR